MTCKVCGMTGVRFYASNRATCVECVKARANTWRAKHLEHARAYDRQRADLPHRVEKRAQIARSLSAEQRRAYQLAYIARAPEKRVARVIIGNRISKGKMARPSSCEACGDEKRLHAHHDDYSRPLEVRWLCHHCHMAVHRQINEARRSQQAQR